MRAITFLFFFILIHSSYTVNAQNNASTASQRTTSIIVTVTTFKNNNGQAILAIFKTSDGFPSDLTEAYKKYKGKIQDGKIAFTVELPEGTYAFSCIHDENKNDEVEKNIIGIPKEGVGLSNYTEKGYPSFNKAKVFINNKTSSLTFKINYL